MAQWKVHRLWDWTDLGSNSNSEFLKKSSHLLKTYYTQVLRQALHIYKLFDIHNDITWVSFPFLQMRKLRLINVSQATQLINGKAGIWPLLFQIHILNHYFILTLWVWEMKWTLLALEDLNEEDMNNQEHSDYSINVKKFSFKIDDIWWIMVNYSVC